VTVPCAREIEAIITRAATISAGEIAAMHAEWIKPSTPIYSAALKASGKVSDGNDREPYSSRCVGSLWGVMTSGWEPVSDAIEALIVRDLIAPDGFTQEHYDLLTGPWRKVIGKVHPDDAEIES
jgi:hypothetical protein